MSTKLKFYLTILLVLVLLGVCFLVFRDILFFFVASLVLSTILNPVVDFVSKLEIAKVRMPRFLGVVVSFLLLVFGFSLFSSLFYPLVTEQVDYFKSLDQNKVKAFLSVHLSELEVYLNNSGLISLSSGTLSQNIESFFVSVLKGMNFEDIINGLLGTTGSILVSVLGISFITFFLLLRKGLVLDLILMSTPNSFFEMLSTALFKIKRLLSNYLLGLVIQMTFVFVLVSGGLSLLGFEYAVTIGVFAAVANLIPYVGPFLGVIFALVVTLTTGTDVPLNSQLLVVFTKIAVVFGSVQLIDNIGLQPIIFSKSVKAHPLEIFVVIFAGASVAGAVGMILAIPVYTVCRVMFQELRKGILEYKVFKT